MSARSQPAWNAATIARCCLPFSMANISSCCGRKPMRDLADADMLQRVLAEHGDAAAARRAEAEQRLEQRRLAGAVLAEHADDVAGEHVDGDGVERGFRRRTAWSRLEPTRSVQASFFSHWSPTSASSSFLPISSCRAASTSSRRRARAAAGAASAAPDCAAVRPRASACRAAARAAPRPRAARTPSRSSSGSRCAARRARAPRAAPCRPRAARRRSGA